MNEQSPLGMFRRKSATKSLPTQSPLNLSSHGGASSIRITPTASEALKEASTETKFTWISFIISVWLIVWGWRHASYNTVSNKLDCANDVCVLSMRSEGYEIEIVEGIRRDMIQASSMLKIDLSSGEEVPYDDSSEEVSESYAGKGKGKNKRKKKKKKKASGKGYSYIFEFTDPSSLETRRVIMSNGKASSSRTRARKQMNKLNSFINGNRDTLYLKESVEFTWQSILAIMFGILFFIFTLILGQFIEPKYIYNKALVRRKQMRKGFGKKKM